MSPRIAAVRKSVFPKQIKIKTKNSENYDIITTSKGILNAAKRTRCDEISLTARQQGLVAVLSKKGVISHLVILPTRLRQAIVTRFKIWGKMSITEKRVKQEGNIIHRGILHSAETVPSEQGEGMKIKLLGHFKKLGW